MYTEINNAAMIIHSGSHHMMCLSLADKSSLSATIHWDSDMFSGAI